MPRVRHTTCLVPTCERERSSHRYCELHYRRFLRGTDLNRPLKGVATAQEVFQYYVAKSRTLPDTSCVIWKGRLDTSGYPYFSAEGTRYSAHRYSWESANGRSADDAFVCHLCDTPACVNPNHLELGNPTENGFDAAVRGRLYAKLSPAKVRLIRKIFTGRAVKQREIAEAFGVSQATVSRALHGNNWVHVSNDQTG